LRIAYFLPMQLYIECFMLSIVPISVLTTLQRLFLTTTPVGRFGMSFLFGRSFGFEFFSHV
jgi:hypothetical protein